jgi:hypothetical protein
LQNFGSATGYVDWNPEDAETANNGDCDRLRRK